MTKHIDEVGSRNRESVILIRIPKIGYDSHRLEGSWHDGRASPCTKKKLIIVSNVAKYIGPVLAENKI